MLNHKHHPHSHHPHSGSQPELLWPRLVMRKWLNRSSRNSEYNADPEDDDATETEDETPRFKENEKGNDSESDTSGAFPKSRRRKSETFRAQYIDAKEVKVSVNTWNVGGKLPPEDLDINDWIDVDNPADVYVIGFQEIIPLNAGNVLGAEDNRPVPIWENIIRRTLNKMQPEKTKFKCYSNPSSPSRFKPSDDAPDIEEEVVLDSDSEGGEEVHPCNEDDLMDGPVGKISTLSSLLSMDDAGDSEKRYSAQKTLDKVNSFTVQDSVGNLKENIQESGQINNKKLSRMLSGSERIGLSWPEPPLDLLAQCVSVSEGPGLLNTYKSFNTSKSFRTYASFKSYVNVDNRDIPEDAFYADLNLDLDSTLYRKRRPPYVRVVSKQMVGVFITIWVRRQLRKHIQNVHVSAVGVGIMGYIGNKGSISVSMSIYQTFFCFVCSHLTSGERDTDAIKRNADVHEIHKRTRFNSIINSSLHKRIENHERIIWLGDLNYRLNLSYEKAHDLISRNEWSKLIEFDQLIRELRKGRAFDGWSEGVLDFPPTYKYERNSGIYRGEGSKAGRRIPAWCDRILSFGKGIRQLSYTRAELRFSDHRPVSAMYMAEVEVFCPRKLQKALTFTDAEIENDADMVMVVDAGINRLVLTNEDAYWN